MRRAEAIKIGKRRYFTGQHCKYGHLSDRWTNNGACIACQDYVRKNIGRDQWFPQVAATGTD